MNALVLRSKLAERHIWDIVRYYRKEFPGSNRADRFLDDVEGVGKLLSKHPTIGHVRYIDRKGNEVRSWTLLNFPYYVFYRVNDDDTKVVVLGVVHHKRGKDKWPGKD